MRGSGEQSGGFESGGGGAVGRLEFMDTGEKELKEMKDISGRSDTEGRLQCEDRRI